MGDCDLPLEVGIEVLCRPLDSIAAGNLREAAWTRTPLFNIVVNVSACGPNVKLCLLKKAVVINVSLLNRVNVNMS